MSAAFYHTHQTALEQPGQLGPLERLVPAPPMLNRAPGQSERPVAFPNRNSGDKSAVHWTGESSWDNGNPGQGPTVLAIDFFFGGIYCSDGPWNCPINPRIRSLFELSAPKFVVKSQLGLGPSCGNRLKQFLPFRSSWLCQNHASFQGRVSSV